MDKRIHFFSQADVIPQTVAPELLGARGREANTLAGLGLPILPGFIFDSGIAREINAEAVRRDIAALLGKIAGLLGREYGGPENPLLLKIAVSPGLAEADYPELRGIGLVKSTITAFAGLAGEEAAAREVLSLVRGMLKVKERIAEAAADGKTLKETARALQFLDAALGIDCPSNEWGKKRKPAAIGKTAGEYLDEYTGFFPRGFFDNAESQLLLALTEVSRMLRLERRDDGEAAVMVTALAPCAAQGAGACYGECVSRDAVTGERKLRGRFFQSAPGQRETAGQSIEQIGPKRLRELEKIARTLEDACRAICVIRFAVDNGKLWLTGQEPAERKTARADIRLLLELAKRKVVDNAYLLRAIEPRRLSEALHPVIDGPSAEGLPRWTGGVTGSPGAAAGRAFFSAAALLQARRASGRRGGGFILVLNSAFAGDAAAIEAADGVLTAEGGYAAHASVLARQFGAVSLIAPGLRIRGGKAVLGDLRFAEGGFLTLDAPPCGAPAVYAGEARLVEPDIKTSGLTELTALAKGFLKEAAPGFHIRCNADTAKDAALALSLGAEGIGLCRTEHMFLSQDRINTFRGMLLAASDEDRKRALDKLQAMQRGDFYEILKVMAGRKAVIRLLDAPLHEFMPRGAKETAALIAHIRETAERPLSAADIKARIEALRETNPMLGRRGCRAAVARPEIYAMQVKALCAAVRQLAAEGVKARPEVLVPFVMNARELRLIAYGRKIEGRQHDGIADIAEASGTAPFPIGAMVELPAAALDAGDIARYAAFFSFGTNDLTQTTLGVSRDDFAALAQDYAAFGLFEGSPFRVLAPPVRELIAGAVERGRRTRPGITCGLCGEHGADPDTLRFCLETGLDYVSCSPWSVPAALLAAAQAARRRRGSWKVESGLGTREQGLGS
ncbi:MAG: pyruvate, phosphate dikinase [Treponematales bacterium]